MEQKSYRIVKNMLLPIKTNIIIDEDFFQVGRKKVNWKDVKACSCHIQSVNKGMNYIIAIDGNQGEKVYLNIVHNIAASQKKKETFADIYDSALQQLEKYHIKPKADQHLKDIERGNEVTLAKATFSKNGIEILKGLMKKEKVFIPMEDVEVEFMQGSGGFNISSKENSKNRMFIQMALPDARYIIHILESLVSK